MFYRLLIVLWLLPFTILMAELPIFAQHTSQAADRAVKDHRLFVPGEIVVKFRPNITPDKINSLNKAHGSKILEKNSTPGLYRLKVSKPVEEATASYQSHPTVEYVQPNYIFAEIGGEFITLMDMEVVIQRISPPFRQHYTQPAAKESLLRSLLNDKLFSKAAKDDKLHNDLEVRRKIDNAVEKTLALVYRLKIQEVTVSEKEMMGYYRENIEKFQTPEQIKGRRILVETKQEAEQILKLLKAGAVFDKLARERSQDLTAKNGGEFGWFGRGRMDPVIEEIAFALHSGEVSGIIATKFGYYIIKVEDKRCPMQLPFSEVSNKIKQSLEARKQKEQIEMKTRELEKKYQVKLHPEFLSEVKVSVTGGAGQEDIIQILRDVIQRPY